MHTGDFLTRIRSFPFPVCAVRQRLAGVRRLGRGVVFRASLRLGVFGGAFDPAHRGHAHVAIEAQRRLLLGRVLWLVARRPPLKEAGGVSSFQERWKSARAMTSSMTCSMTRSRGCGEKFLVSDIEEAFGMTFSDEVLWSLRKALGEYDLVFLSGSDGFAEFLHWRSWRFVGRLVSLAVCSRRGTDLQARLGGAARALPCARRGAMLRLASGGRKRRYRGLQGSMGGGEVRWGFVSMPCLDASSSALRGGVRS